MKILLADDEPALRITLSDDLADAGHQVTAVADGSAAITALNEVPFDCVITDLKMPGAGGIEVLGVARESGAEVIVITGAATIDSAIEAMKAGACDYLQKPFLNEEVVLILKRLEQQRALVEEVEQLRAVADGRPGFPGVVGRSEAMRKVLGAAGSAAQSDVAVLITGESGSGKEVIAKAIHEESPRANGSFVPISCAIINEHLLEDELFGHEKGAFTDAKSRRAGKFEQADGGTVFLDDIDDMQPSTQGKLLRVLQDHKVERLGGNKPVDVDIRVIAATKASLWKLVQKKIFREDLYYRLDVLPVIIPPLRDRLEDIPLLVETFVRKHGGGRAAVSNETMAGLAAYSWPGNVRQLENSVCRALALGGGGAELLLEHLMPNHLAEDEKVIDWSLTATIKDAERNHILKALATVNGNKTKAADLLGISRKNLWEKMKGLGI